MGHTQNNPRLRKQRDEKQVKMQEKLAREQAIRDSMAKKPSDNEIPIGLRNRFGYGYEQFKPLTDASAQVQVQPPVWTPNVSKRCPQSIGCQCGLSICRMAR